MLHTLKRLLLLGLFFGSGYWANSQTLQLTSPNGGESCVGGSTRNITWTYTNIDNIKIEYSLNNGLNWIEITASYPTSALSYSWTVPCTGSNQAKVRITSTLGFVQDESNNVFTIPQGTVSILYPNGGESYSTGTGQYIEWLSSGITTLRLQYTIDNGNSWTDIGDFPGVNSFANWIPSATVSSQTRIRAFNIENSIDRDSSNALFTITTSLSENVDKFKGGAQDGYNMCSNLTDTIHVNSPNGGESISPNSIVPINWTYRHVDDIKIEYSTNNGSTWTSIVSGIPASQLSYNWTVPNSPSTQCLVRIIYLVGNINDVSDNVFTITSAYVNLTYPNGGESFGTGTGQYIEWTSNSVATVKLEYSEDNGNSWTEIGTAVAANNYANWIPPTTIGSHYLIRVSDNDVASVNDVSDQNFSILASISEDLNKFKGGSNDGYSMNNNRTDSLNITSPIGGESWTSASTRTITWTYNDVDNISIEYTLDDGITWSTIAASLPASQLSYSWTVPTTPSYLCRIRLKDITRPISDQSNAVFTIPNAFVQITYPNGGENYEAGTGQYIEWNYSDLATVKLEYSVDAGSTWNIIGAAVAAHKYANWVVPTVASSQLLIRATDIDNPIYTDQSNTSFSSITSPIEDANKFKGGINDGYSMYSFKDQYIKVLAPNGGEIWGNTTTQQIKWSTLNTSENVNIEYSIDNESSWNSIATNLVNFPGIFNWTISSPLSSICKVRVTSNSGVLIDKSDNFFTIANPSGITTNTIIGNSFCSGSTIPVSFGIGSVFNNGNQFIVQLSDSTGSFNGQVMNLGSVASTNPQTINAILPPIYYNSSLYRLRVLATNPPTIGTDNGSNFTIIPLPRVNLGNDTTICSGTSLVLDATNSSSTYLWNTGATTSTISVNQPGTYSVAVTNTCGTSNDTIIIQQIQPPTVNLGNDTSICLNSSILLNAGSNTNSYLWSTGATNPQINAVLTGTYSVTASNSCGSATGHITLSTASAPTLYLGPDQVLCPGSTVQLNAGNPGYPYLWSNGATSQMVTITAPGVYWVNVNTACGVISDQISIYDGTVALNAGADQTICIGDSAILQATGANSFSWDTGQSLSSITVTPISTTTYTVQATNIYNCTDSATVIVNIANPVTGSDNIIACSPITWIDGNVYTSNNNTATFNIASGAVNGCDSMVTLNLTILPAASGTDNLTSCSPISWIDGNVYNSNNNTATFNIASGAANGCDSIVTLNLTILPAASGTDNLTSCSPITWIDGNVYTSNNNTATFNIVGGATNGCDSLVTLNLTIAPTAVLSVNSTTICSGETATLTAIPSISGGTFLWSTGETASMISTNPLITSSLLVTYTVGGCETLDSALITVLPNPIVSVGSDVNMCLGDSVMLSATGAQTYSWDNGIGLGNDVFVSPSNLTSYVVLGTDLLGCIGKDTVVVNPAQFIPPTLTTFPSNPPLCDGTGVVTLDPAGNFSIYWGNGVIGENGYDLCPGLTVVYVIENDFGCQYSEYGFVEETGNSYPLSIQLSVQDVSFDGNCDGTAQFFGFGGIPPYTYELVDAANVIVNTEDWADMLCSGYYNIHIFDALSNTDSLQFYIADPSNVFSFNPYPDSIIIDTLHTDIYEDCSIDFETVDSAWVSQINYINADTAIITWAIQDMNGVQYIDQSYNLTNLQGSFTIELTVFCPGKAIGGGPYVKVYRTIYITNDFSLTINDLTDDNLISFFPNPTHDFIQIKSDKKKIEIIQIYDSFGKEVFLSNPIASKNQLIKLPIECGLYTLKIIFEDGRIFSKRVVKTNK